MVNINRSSTIAVATSPVVPSLSTGLDAVQLALLEIQQGTCTGNSIRDRVSVAMREIGKPCPITVEVSPGKGLSPLPYFMSPQERIDTLTSRAWPMTLRDVFNLSRWNSAEFNAMPYEKQREAIENCRVKCNGREIRGSELWEIINLRENDVTLSAGTATSSMPERARVTTVVTPPTPAPSRQSAPPMATLRTIEPNSASMLERIKETLRTQGSVQFAGDVTDSDTCEYLIAEIDAGRMEADDSLRSFTVIDWVKPTATLSLSDRLRANVAGNTPPTPSIAPTPKAEGLAGYEWDAEKKRYRPLRQEGEANAAYMQRCRLCYEAQRNGTFQVASGQVPLTSLVQEPVSMVAIADKALTEGRTAATNPVSRGVKEEIDTTKMARAIASAMGEAILSEERVREIVREEIYRTFAYLLTSLPSHRKPE